jgi:NitT/TauT family transport system substrate-binding protein
MKKYFFLLILSLGLLNASTTFADQKKEKVVASWLPIMQTMAYYVALEEKLFEKAGIEIESVKFQNPNQIIDSLVSGQADFGPPGAAAGITVIAESRYPGTFKVFGLQGGGIKVNLINDGLIVKNDSTITSFKDLRGKSLGTLPGIQWKTISRYILRQNGLDPDKDVRLSEVAVPLHVPSVVAGTVDATLSLEPVGSIAVASKEAKRAMTNPVAMFIADPFYSGVSVLSTKFIKERPVVAKKVVEVLDEATRLANKDFDKYRPIIAKYTAIKPDQVQLVAQPYLRAYKDLNDTDIKSYQALVDVFHKEGVLKERVDVRTVMLKPTDF